ncbi:MAG TPA: hypothetical protein VMV84_06500 [Dehalococcoidales bacterium]|nr:hypothetical protein [Dehalococcoidales bacterium]
MQGHHGYYTRLLIKCSENLAGGRRVRRCDRRCHEAKNPECNCWCGGLFHGSAGASNRAALVLAPWAMPPQYKEGLTKYIASTRTIGADQ